MKSPIAQVDYYKKIIFSLLVPNIGEAINENNKVFGTIKTAVFFYNASQKEAFSFCYPPKNEDYKIPILGRDSLAKESLKNNVPDATRSTSSFWKDDFNSDLLIWLFPPKHFIDSTRTVNLSANQKKVLELMQGHHRIRGIAGSGKTLSLAYKAAELASKGKTVLVLTYNITLRHYIKDMLSQSPFDFHWKTIVINHFHGFCADVLNGLGIEWPKSDSNDNFFRVTVPKVVEDAIQNNQYNKYDAIFIDEAQDFYSEWYTLLCKFLTDYNTIFAARDVTQDIYDRKQEWLDRRRAGMKQFDDWVELKSHFRLPQLIAKLCNKFSKEFSLPTEVDLTKAELPHLFSQDEQHLVWWNIDFPDWLSKVMDAFKLVKNNSVHKHPSDIAILVLNHEIGQQCVSFFKSTQSIESNHIFKAKSDSTNTYNNKLSFWLGDSRLKISTIHSFKGWEVQNVILIITDTNTATSKEQDMLVYTGITRPKKNLIVINICERYKEFSQNFPQTW